MAKQIVIRHAVERKDEAGKVVINPKTNKPVMDSTYWTEPNGQGKQAASVISAGGGKYYVARWVDDDTDLLTVAEISEIKAEAFKFAVADSRKDNGEIRSGKLRKACEAIDSIIQAANSNSSKKYGACYTEENARNILAALMDRVTRLENSLMGGGQEAGEVFDI